MDLQEGYLKIADSAGSGAHFILLAFLFPAAWNLNVVSGASVVILDHKCGSHTLRMMEQEVGRNPSSC